MIIALAVAVLPLELALDAPVVFPYPLNLNKPIVLEFCCGYGLVINKPIVAGCQDICAAGTFAAFA